MSPGTLHGRRGLVVVFGLFLASGVMVGIYCLSGRRRLDPPAGRERLWPLPHRRVFIRTRPSGVVGGRSSHVHGVPGIGTYASEWR